MYCTVNNIVDALDTQTLIELTDDNATTVDTVLIQDNIDDVSIQIDDYLRGRYTLPLANSQPVLKDIAVELVRYRLYRRRNILTDTIKGLYETAVQNLILIQKGVITLSVPSGTSVPTPYLVEEKKPVISQTLLDNFIKT